MIQIEAIDLSKSYGKVQVLDKLNITFSNDCPNFIVGPNGSGKSTLLKCIMKIIKYQGRIKGNDVAISYMPEQLPLPDYLSVDSFLNLIGRIRGMTSQEIASVLRYYYEKFGLAEFRSTSIINLSKGTRQKVMLIQTLMTEVDIYVFDEPISGLDDEAKKVFMEELKNLKKKKKLIIISTHHLKNYPFRNKRVIELNDYFDLEAIENELA